MLQSSRPTRPSFNTMAQHGKPSLSVMREELPPGMEEVSSHSSGSGDDQLIVEFASALNINVQQQQDIPIAVATSANPINSPPRRRASVRKSIMGLVIDVEDEKDQELFADCDDYTDNFSAAVKPGPQAHTKEELRTRFEAMDDASMSTYQRRQQSSNVDHLALQFLHKNMLEALEDYHHVYQCQRQRYHTTGGRMHSALSRAVVSKAAAKKLTKEEEDEEATIATVGETEVTTTTTTIVNAITDRRRHSHHFGAHITPFAPIQHCGRRRRQSQHNERRSIFGLVLEYTDFDDLSETDDEEGDEYEYDDYGFDEE